MGTTTAVASAESQSQEQDNTELASIRGWQDVQGINEHWAKRLFQWGMSQNMINGYGYPNENLKPDQVVTEAEFLKMLYRAMGMVLPTASNVYGYDPSESWADGPYRIAGYLNHPTVGGNNSSMRLQPITKLSAAEIISASQGVHYTGSDAITYLIGVGLANNEASSSEQFDGNSTFSRAEALQWIRQLAIHGKLEIHERPVEPTDQSLLTLPDTPVVLVPDFSTEPVTQEDFNLFGSGDFPGVKFDDMKRTVEEQFGVSEEKNIFNYDIYPLLSAHFNTNGRLDAWSIDSYTNDTSSKSPSLRTNKGIVVGESTLSDIILQYGSAGVSSKGIVEFFYEKADDGTYRDISIYDLSSNIDKVYMIAFIVDHETNVVFHVIVSSYKTAALGD